MVIVVPITSRNWGIPLHVRVNPPEGGLTQSSVILCDHIRSIAKERLLRRLGVVSAEIVAQVEERLLVLLDL